MSPRCSTSVVENRSASKQSNSASHQHFLFYSSYPFGAGRLHFFFLARTQLVPAKHGVTRTGHASTPRFSVRRQKQKHISISRSSIRLTPTSVSKTNPTRRFNTRPTHVCSLRPVKRERFTFLFISFSYSGPYLVSILGMNLLCGCFQKRQKAILALRSLFPILSLFRDCFRFYLCFCFWKYPAYGGEKHTIIHHSSSKRLVRPSLSLHADRFFFFYFFIIFVRYPSR